ncbi:MAG TPA: YfiR family protein, partial [Gemmatimonadales bacterium]|nr:YfiR family protein [Gemmatimonadales bacterium]
MIRGVGLLLALALMAAQAAAQDTLPAPEQAVKAAYLLSFTRYVEWPAAAFPDSAAPVNICVVGDEDLPDVVRQTIEGRRSRGRP